MNVLTMPITVLKGIGEKRAKDFEKMGINSVYDLIYYFPVRYQNRKVFLEIDNLTNGDEACVKCFIKSPVKMARVRKNLTVANAVAEDETGSIKVVWYNNKYIDKQIKTDTPYIFYGKVTKGKSGLQLTNPVVEKGENEGESTGKIIPVYRRVASVPQKVIRSAVSMALEYSKEILFSSIPKQVEEKYDVMPVFDALSEIHYPSDEESLVLARERFLFEDFFLLQVAMLKLRKMEREDGLEFKNTDVCDFISNLPFTLTDAQQRVISEIRGDLVKGKCIKRLVQGDVGSGKTVVAMCACFIAAKNGYQTAVMAPTEILAKQHFENFKKILPSLNVGLLTSSVKKKEKDEVLLKLEKGETDVVVGTHALIQDNVKFHKLGMIVADEQHRFGVVQRQKLIEKGDNPHIVVMTATPIPRTLSLIMYGDLNISVIDELPPGRQEIKTYLLPESYRNRAYGFVQEIIKEGGQAYVVCPLVDESEVLDLKNATNFAEKLKEEMPDVSVGLVHGKMKEEEKNKVMTAFKKGETDILVSTTVIEVGVDVPNATIMVIENAERFGLSQLHQLRGRVGRGDRQSYCITFAKTGNARTLERLKIFESSTDGFYISEEDLKLRGPGDFFGTRQSGVPMLESMSGELDTQILYKARNAVEDLKDKKLFADNNEKKLINFMINRKFLDEQLKNILN